MPEELEQKPEETQTPEPEGRQEPEYLDDFDIDRLWSEAAVAPPSEGGAAGTAAAPEPPPEGGGEAGTPPEAPAGEAQPSGQTAAPTGVDAEIAKIYESIGEKPPPSEEELETVAPAAPSPAEQLAAMQQAQLANQYQQLAALAATDRDAFWRALYQLSPEAAQNVYRSAYEHAQQELARANGVQPQAGSPGTAIPGIEQILQALTAGQGTATVPAQQAATTTTAPAEVPKLELKTPEDPSDPVSVIEANEENQRRIAQYLSEALPKQLQSQIGSIEQKMQQQAALQLILTALSQEQAKQQEAAKQQQFAQTLQQMQEAKAWQDDFLRLKTHVEKVKGRMDGIDKRFNDVLDKAYAQAFAQTDDEEDVELRKALVAATKNELRTKYRNDIVALAQAYQTLDESRIQRAEQIVDAKLKGLMEKRLRDIIRRRSGKGASTQPRERTTPSGQAVAPGRREPDIDTMWEEVDRAGQAARYQRDPNFSGPFAGFRVLDTV